MDVEDRMHSGNQRVMYLYIYIYCFGMETLYSKAPMAWVSDFTTFASNKRQLCLA